MKDVKQTWTIAGSLLLAAATASPAPAQDLPPESSGSISEQPASPAASNFRAETEISLEAPLSADASCPPGLRLAPLARWRQNRRARLQNKLWGYPEEFGSAPLGASVGSHVSAQIAGGQAARMVLYQYDFFPLSDQLKPRGQGELARIAFWAPGNACPVIIEATPGRPELDDARRQTVWRDLAGGPDPIPIERIIIAVPGTRGLGGAEALVIDRNRLTQTASRGAGSGGGSGMSAGSSAPGRGY